MLNGGAPAALLTAYPNKTMLQSVINFLYRYPKAYLIRYKRFGGYFGYRRMLMGKALMQRAATDLPPVASAENGLTVYFLTGKKYLYQTLFCIRSLTQVSENAYQFVLVDDGSFDERLTAQIKRQLPGARIVTSLMIGQNLDKQLPEAEYPVLHHKRKVYPHIKKLTDIHTIPGNGWKLVLDSDMLFWNKPSALIAWLENPDKAIYMRDCRESYGYTRELMEDLCGSPVPSLLNVGVIGLDSSQVNWKDLENWTKTLEEKESRSYYLEQALTAMLLATGKAHILPGDEYIVNPAAEAIGNQTGILHHYVDLSKEGYFKQAWRRYL
jgi:hypothetical protein